MDHQLYHMSALLNAINLSAIVKIVKGPSPKTYISFQLARNKGLRNRGLKEELKEARHLNSSLLA